jgi:hypothetical protein
VVWGNPIAASEHIQLMLQRNALPDQHMLGTMIAHAVSIALR